MELFQPGSFLVSGYPIAFIILAIWFIINKINN